MGSEEKKVGNRIDNSAIAGASRGIMLKRETSFWDPFPRACAPATQVKAQKRRPKDG